MSSEHSRSNQSSDSRNNLVPLGVGVVAVVLLAGWGSYYFSSAPKQKSQTEEVATETPDPPQAPLPPEKVLELVFTYGSEKENWITAVTAEFNKARHPAPGGKVIQVKAIPMGSGECMASLLGRFDQTEPNEKAAAHAHLTSPASGAFIELANAEASAAGQEPLLARDRVRSLVRSPVVIAMWKPMAERLGWPERPLGWTEILELATSKAGWAGKGAPQWGRFKFGHTHPEHSNSGLISLLTETYAGAKKAAGLTAEDVRSPAVGDFVGKIERSVVFYGSSTGFLGKRMVKDGPGALSAAVLYENMVLEANTGAQPPEFPLVSIYPREGTFWSDHPVGVVERPWVTPDHRAAAETYIDYLLANDQQVRAMESGFRPGKETVQLDAGRFSARNGVDPNEPRTILEVPDAPVLRAMLGQWPEVKKPARVTLVLDTSGSMQADQRLLRAKVGAETFIDLLSPRDELSLLVFNRTLTWVPLSGKGRAAAMDAAGKKAAKAAVQQQIAQGDTALYDATLDAFNYLKEQNSAANDPAEAHRIAVVVVLTDGEDTNSKLKAKDLIARIKYNPEAGGVRVFTIAYGTEADRKVLKEIAEATAGEAHAGDPATIQKVFRKIIQGF